MSVSFGRITRLQLGCTLGALALLSGCGGGGAPSRPISAPAPAPTPTPTPTPTPAPTPTPTPTPISSFDIAEYRNSDGPAFHNATAAWSQGITGRGAKIAIVDSGIDTDNPEFAGRIDPASRDVAGNGTVEKPLSVHDIHATVLHQLGIDHLKQTFRFGGRDHRLTDVHGTIVTDILV